MRASDFEISNYSKLDKILSKLCDMVVRGQESDRDYGMVAAAVVDPSNRIVARLNRPGKDGKRIHAEHAAMLDYTNKYGDIPKGSIIITTLSPCNKAMDERDGPSCTELINNSTVKKVYCGYMDPTQDNDTRQFSLMETADRELRNKCKQFADTFLDDIDETQSLEERRKKKRRVRHAAYGPGLFGGYGYYAGYSGDSSGDGGGGVEEDQHPNERPRGPEFKPTMPKGTVKVDVSDVYDWYKLGQHISDLDGLGKHDFGKGPPSAIISFGDEETEHKYIKNLKKTGLTTTDIDPKAHGKKTGQKTDPTYNVGENFADGKNPQDKGDSKRHGINTKASVSSLRKTAKQGGRKGQLAHWLANMKSGRQK
jgi:pyrimidine deaminase RibD-like protein